MTSLDAPLMSRLLQALAECNDTQARYHTLLREFQSWLSCDAVALLKCEGELLLPVAFVGLGVEMRGRRFVLNQHPRLQRILQSDEVTRFDCDAALPDPYDGLIGERGHLLVHDCMGFRIDIDGQCWGLMTLDALQTHQFEMLPSELLGALMALTRCVVALSEPVSALQQALWQQVPIEQGLAPTISTQGLIGSSAVMRYLSREINTVAGSDLAVLISGETGVGKELVAQQLHAKSSRAQRAFVHTNCAAIPENLFESELFGHVKGAFTGATRDRSGRFESANRGTLFLDEIGELPLGAQAKLLRALQDGEVQRVGGEVSQQVDVRVIAATNRDLAEEVRQGRFRRDLYHRLSVYPLEIPPLRERGQDVLELAGHFLERAQQRWASAQLRLSDAARRLLLQHHWPGNVRELEHCLSRASLKALTEQGKARVIRVTPQHLSLEAGHMPAPSPAIPVEPELKSSLKEATEQFQKQYIQQALADNGGNRAAAARQLGVDRSNLLRLMNRLG